jgi:hypothetical protein
MFLKIFLLLNKLLSHYGTVLLVHTGFEMRDDSKGEKFLRKCLMTAKLVFFVIIPLKIRCFTKVW